MQPLPFPKGYRDDGENVMISSVKSPHIVSIRASSAALDSEYWVGVQSFFAFRRKCRGLSNIADKKTLLTLLCGACPVRACAGFFVMALHALEI